MSKVIVLPKGRRRSARAPKQQPRPECLYDKTLETCLEVKNLRIEALEARLVQAGESATAACKAFMELYEVISRCSAVVIANLSNVERQAKVVRKLRAGKGVS
jgi:hypothetical protein